MANTEKRIFLFVGEDEYLAENAARKVLFDFVPEEIRSTALETVEGKGSNIEEQKLSLANCRASVDTPPFFDPVKATWWRGVDFFPGGGVNGKVSEEIRSSTERFLATLTDNPLPSNQLLVITAKKLLKTSLVAKQFKQIAEIKEFATEAKSGKRAQMALALLPDLAAAEKLKFAPGAAEAFIAQVGTDTRRIVSELAKLRDFLGDETDVVTAEAVSQISSPGGEEPDIWELTDAIGARNAKKFLRIAAKFEGSSGFGIQLTTMLERHFREQIVLKDAIERKLITPLGGWIRTLTDDDKAELDAAGIGPNSGKSSWMMNKAANASANYTLAELRIARWRILQAREKLVSSSADDSSVITTVLRILAKGSR